jgi:hypothetical protein
MAGSSQKLTEEFDAETTDGRRVHILVYTPMISAGLRRTRTLPLYKA